MSKQLPPRPNLDYLRDLAKSLLSDYRRADASAIDRFKQSLPSFKGGTLALHDAQSVIAREYGQPSWQKLVAHVEEIRAREGITPEIEARFVDLITSGSESQARRLLELYPGLPRFSPLCALVCAEIDLVQEIDPTAKLGKQELTPIEYVAYSCIHRILPERYQAQEECARILLDRGANPNSFMLYGEEKWPIPALFGAAAESRHIGITRLLLSRGANPNDGESIYHSAERGNIEALEALAEYGADFKSPGALGYLVFHHRFDEEMKKGTKWLLEHGADPNFARSEKEETPLHNVCRFAKDSDLLAMLLDHGADPTARNADGDTPYLVALLSANQAALELLEARGIRDEPSPDAAFFAACARNDAGAIQMALHADPTALTRLGAKGAELMRQFAEQGNLAGLIGLLSAGFPADGDSDATPLHFACFHGQLEAARLLIGHGSPLDTIDPWHSASPLQWAAFASIHARREDGKYPEVAKLVIASGSSLENAQKQLEDPMLPQDMIEAIREAVEATDAGPNE